MAENKESFETAMSRIEEITRRLERGDATLDESLTLFEEGTRLIKNCSRLLDSAEQKVVKLRGKTESNVEEVPFDSAEDE